MYGSFFYFSIDNFPREQVNQTGTRELGQFLPPISSANSHARSARGKRGRGMHAYSTLNLAWLYAWPRAAEPNPNWARGSRVRPSRRGPCDESLDLESPQVQAAKRWHARAHEIRLRPRTRPAGVWSNMQRRCTLRLSPGFGFSCRFDPWIELIEEVDFAWLRMVATLAS